MEDKFLNFLGGVEEEDEEMGFPEVGDVDIEFVEGW